MRATRRLWHAAGVGLSLLVLGVLAGRPSLFGGAALVGAWVAADLVGYVRGQQRAFDGIAIRQEVRPERVLTDETSDFSLSVETSEPSPVAVDFEPSIPAGLDAESDLMVHLDRGSTSAMGETRLTAPVAGEHVIGPATGTVRDPGGLAETRVSMGEGPTLRVAPRVPRNIHVGQAGEGFGGAWGDHPADTQGAGHEPAELREYVPGDPARRINWRATARLGEPHVLEFEEETDRRLFCILDTRPSMAAGPAGQTKLDYLREVALGYVDAGEAAGDPLGVATVGEDGVRDRLAIDATPQHYARLIAALRDVDPSAGPGPDRPGTGSGPRLNPELLREGEDRFSETLRPFFVGGRGYDHVVENDPLAAAVRTISEGTAGSVWTVLLTDDSRPRELRTAVSVARQYNRQVLVFLAPSVLFEPGGLADLEAAYDRYVEFEELRRELDDLPQVSAYEVGPGDRFAAVLERGQARRGQVGGA